MVQPRVYKTNFDEKTTTFTYNNISNVTLGDHFGNDLDNSECDINLKLVLTNKTSGLPWNIYSEILSDLKVSVELASSGGDPFPCDIDIKFSGMIEEVDIYMPMIYI